jgi:hypothetical protein
MISSVKAPSSEKSTGSRLPCTARKTLIGFDLSSPCRSSARGPKGLSASLVVASARVTDSRVPSSDAGLDWGDAGIGAGVLLGLLLLALGGTLAVMHRRQSLRRHAATTG